MDSIRSKRSNRRFAVRLEKLEHRRLMAGDLSPSSVDNVSEVPAIEIVNTTVVPEAAPVTHTVQHDPLDGNRDGKVTAADALMVINHLNRKSIAEGESLAEEDSVTCDYNSDNRVTAADALIVINTLNNQANGLSYQESFGWLTGGCSCGGRGCAACSVQNSDENQVPTEVTPTLT